MATATIVVPQDVRDALEELAEQSGQSQEEVLREAIKSYLRERRRRRFRSIGMISDPDLQGSEIEDWLHREKL